MRSNFRSTISMRVLHLGGSIVHWDMSLCVWSWVKGKLEPRPRLAKRRERWLSIWNWIPRFIDFQFVREYSTIYQTHRDLRDYCKSLEIFRDYYFMACHRSWHLKMNEQMTQWMFYFDKHNNNIRMFSKSKCLVKAFVD